MTKTCDCGVALVSRVETERSQCLRCTVQLADSVPSLLSKISDLEYENGRETAKVRWLKEMRDGRIACDNAFRDGTEASVRGISSDDNPYPEGDERDAWDAGWDSSELAAASKRAAAIMSWAADALSIVSEIVGGTEVCPKIDAIVSKLRETVGP